MSLSNYTIKNNEIVDVKVTALNNGTYDETFNVTLYANTTIIGTLMNINLRTEKSTTIIFKWDTTNFSKGTYVISAYAWNVANETDTANNIRTADSMVTMLNSNPWETCFTELDGFPIVDFVLYNEKLYAAANNTLYVYDGSSWNIIHAPIYVTSLMCYEDKLIVGGQGRLYYYDETSFGLVLTVPNYIKVLGVYNDTFYAGTMLDRPPKLYYCNGSAENPSNWYIDTEFSAILNFSGPFGSIDSFEIYNNAVFVSSGGTLYSFNGTDWNITKTFDDVYTILDMAVYNGKLYLATRDQAWRKPYYLGYSGFSGRVIEFDGNNWITVFDHDYWIYSLETYNYKLYAGTANEIFIYNGTCWIISFNAVEGAFYAISMITYDGNIYAGMGNGYILVDPDVENVIWAFPKLETSPNLPSFSAG